MKILLCHSYYQQRGGEDVCFEEERDLLAAGGHDVVQYVRRNDELKDFSRLAAARAMTWNGRAARDVANLVEDVRPAVVYSINSFPLISPAICHAAHRRGAAVVQGLHNYRLLCANASFYREGHVCETCLHRAVPWQAIVRRCYHDSATHSAAVVAMQLVHRALGTWRRKVDAFVTPSEFARQKLIEGGFPADRVHAKYNSVHPDPGVGAGDGGYIAFASRLAPEKGVATLLAAWRRHRALPRLKVIGDGPLLAEVEAAARTDGRIECLGYQPAATVHQIYGAALAVVMPSTWYETFGRTIAEAFAGGTPVIASRLGAMAELVEDGRTGFLFRPGDADDLDRAAVRLIALPSDQLADLRKASRKAYEERFMPARNYERLTQILETAIERRAARGVPAKCSDDAANDVRRRDLTSTLPART